MKKIVSSLLMTMLVFLSYAQNEMELIAPSTQHYKTSIGVKGGSPYVEFGGGSISVKHFIQGMNAVEFNLGGNAYSLWIQGMYERNYILDKGFEGYWGLGADIGGWNSRVYYIYPDPRTQVVYESGTAAGFDSAFGLEYTFENLPLNLAMDIGPTLRAFPDIGLGMRGGVAMRFAIF